jgi:Uncharacterized conserved protein
MSYPTPCLICRNPVECYEPQYCCGGHDCTCMGQPVDPCICSDACMKALFSVEAKGSRGNYEARRIAHGIELWEPELKIITSHVFPPIPIRTRDWMAYIDGLEEEGTHGYGATEEEAINDLKIELEARE